MTATLKGIPHAAVGLLALAGLLGWGLLAGEASAGGPAGTEARAGPAREAIAGGGCRWEVAEAFARHDGPGPSSQRAATMLLDQCTGRTWVLVSGPRFGLEWRALGREFWPE